MANGYYFLISSLPELNLTDKNLQFDLVSYRDFIWESLDDKDAQLVKTLYYFYDISNLSNLIKKSEADWNNAGNYTRQEFEAMLKDPETLPDFLSQFYEETNDQWDAWNVKQIFNNAMVAYLDWAHKTPNIFLSQWLKFSLNLKNLLIYLNSQRFNLDPKEEVLGNTYEAKYLQETNFENLNISWWDFPVKKIQAHFDNPNVALREYLIDEIRWNYLNELEEAFSFGIERLLAFAIRLHIINRNIANSEEAGRKRLQNLLDSITEDYKMPETFN